MCAWAILLAVIGEQVGHRWQSLHGSLQYADYAVLAAAAIALAFLATCRPWARTS